MAARWRHPSPRGIIRGGLNSSLPTISVIVPSLNQGRFIGEALASIFDQEYPQLEVVVMDGGSTDESVSVIRSFAPRLKHWQSEPDHGQAAAINAGLKHCRGELVAWLNSDDFYCRDSLWILARAFRRHPGAGLYVGNGYRYDDETGKRTPFCPRHVAFSRDALTRGLDYVLQPSAFIARSAWDAAGGLNPTLRYGFDWDFFIRVAESHSVVTINEFLSASREHQTTKTATGSMARALELLRIAQERSGREITPGTAFYLFGTLLQLKSGDLPRALNAPLSDGLNVLKREMARTWGGDETFPVASDAQDSADVPLADVGAPSRRHSAGPAAALPAISIVVPPAMRGRRIGPTLESLLAQDYPRLEVMVVDPPTEGQDRQVLDRHADRLVLVARGGSTDVAQALDRGFRRGTGDVVTWITPGDRMAEDSLWVVGKAFAEDPGADMVLGNALYIDGSGSLALDARERTAIHDPGLEPWRQVPRSWASTRLLPQANVFVRRHLLEGTLDPAASDRARFSFDRLWRAARKSRVVKLDRILTLYQVAEEKPAKAPLVAVDLTRMLPGGVNGGAKVLTLQLLERLPRLAPDWRLLLLTASWNHEELARFDGAAVERLCVRQEEKPPSASCKRDPLREALYRIHSAFPLRPPLLAARLGRGALEALEGVRRFLLRCPPAGTLLASRGVDVLLCPFTEMTYAEPTVPTVSVVYDLQHRQYPQFLTPAEVARRDEELQQLRRCDRIVCISEHTRASLRQALDLPSERVQAIPIDVQIRLRRPSREELGRTLSSLGLAGRPYAFYPANFWPHKNHRMLLTAFGLLRSRRPDLDLDLVLTGALEEPARELRQAALRMGLVDRVHFLGYLGDDALAGVFEGCRMVVFPSLFEGFGIPLLEAMHFGKPVACSNVTSLPEVAGEAALFFDPRKPDEIARALAQLMDDPGLAARLARRASERLRELRSRDMAERYVDVLGDAMKSPKVYLDELGGVFEDGWTGPLMTLTYGPGRGGRVAEIELAAPAFLPAPRTSIGLKNGRLSSKRWLLRRGGREVLRLPLPTCQGQVVLEVAPAFRPSETGLGPDTRLLGCVCQDARIVHDDGTEKLLLRTVPALATARVS